MQRTRIKICGITNRDDALLAVQQGADALGFIFYEKSPRHISRSEAAMIIADLPAFVTAVGVIVNEDLAVANALSAETGIHVLQCHGDEDAAYCQQLTTPFVKALRLGAVSETRAYAASYPGAIGILVDKMSRQAYGGTGEAIQWDERAPTERLILAGGLDSENVGEAIALVRPYAVDVVTGVEREKGTKDPLKIKSFIAAVNVADRKFEDV